jgi:hypothetical protein
VVPGPRPTAIDLPERPDADQAWAGLGSAITRRIDAALDAVPAGVAPLGRWLAADTSLGAYRASGEVYSQSALLVGIAETTFRRRYQKAREQLDAGDSARPDDWAEMHKAVATCIAAATPGAEDLLERLRELLIDKLTARIPDDTKLAARLMGVTEPTYRKWLSEKPTKPS